MTHWMAHPFPLDMAHRDHDYDVGGVALGLVVLMVLVVLSSILPVGSSPR